MAAHRSIMGSGAYIIRAGTEFAEEYLSEVERVVLRFGRWWFGIATEAQRQALSPEKEFPDYADVLSRQRMIYRQTIPGYPLPWGSMVMSIQQPLSLRYRHRVSLSLPSPVLTNYR